MHLDIAQVGNMWNTGRVAALLTRVTSTLSAWILIRGLVSVSVNVRCIIYITHVGLICMCVDVWQVPLDAVICSLLVTVC